MPALSILEPAPGTQFEATQPATPVEVSLLVENWEPYPAAGKSVSCFLNGEVDGTTQDLTYLYSDVPAGRRQLACQLQADSVPLANCEAAAFIFVAVRQDCTGQFDKSCDDSNPCSKDSCVYTMENKWQCQNSEIPDPCCCVSTFDCKCQSGTWGACDPELGLCSGCVDAGDCDDGNLCTIDECVDCGECVNTWVSCD